MRATLVLGMVLGWVAGWILAAALAWRVVFPAL